MGEIVGTGEIAPVFKLRRDAWVIQGRGQIDGRPPTRGRLLIWRDGSWRAEVATFTLAARVDLMFRADEGGHLCGPADVEASRATTEYGLEMGTNLAGCGPILIVAPDQAPELLDAEMVDGEVIDG